MIKVAVWSTSLLLLVVFYSWGTAGDPLLPFTVFFPQFHLIFLSACLAVLVLGRDREGFEPALSFIERHRYTVFPALGFIGAILINLLVFDNIPHVQDGIHYKHMAEVFAGGRLAHVMPVHYEFFGYPFFMVDGSRMISLFMPGYPAFLMPFAVLGLTFLANPFLTGINLILVGRLADILFGSRCSTYSMFLFFSSPFMMTMGGTWMPHPFTAFLTLISVISFVKFWRTKQLHLLMLVGTPIGWLVFTRPQNALFLSVLFFALLLFNFRRFDAITTITVFSIPLIFGITVLFVYNYSFTGSPFTFIQDIYFNITEPVNDCHRVGLGAGCHHCNGESLPEGGMTWQHGLTVTKERIGPLVMETFPHPLFFSFIVLSLVLTRDDPFESRRKIFLVVLFLAPVAGYFLFYFNGNVFGPRYLYEGSVFLIILAAAGIESLLTHLRRVNSERGVGVVASFLVAGLLFEFLVSVPIALEVYEHGFWGVDDQLKELVESGEYQNSVVFISMSDDMSYGNGLTAMDLSNIESNSTIFVKDLGEASNSKYMHFMNGREFFRLTYVPWTDTEVQPIRTEPSLSASVLHVEMEDKFPPYLMSKDFPDYCNRYPVPDHIRPHLGFEYMSGNLFSRRRSLYCRFLDAGQRYTFGQYFPEGGVYQTTLASVSGTVFADLEVAMDGARVASIDLDQQRGPILTEHRFEIEVSAGLHTFQIAPHPGSLPERNYFMIDFIRFEKTGETR
ncbi:MAG: hypothetical protein AB1Z65_11665 [Candidatus Sulfomarinibacteraceae bacterium]